MVDSHTPHSSGTRQTICLDASPTTAQSFDAGQIACLDTSCLDAHSSITIWEEASLLTCHLSLGQTLSEVLALVMMPSHTILLAMVLAKSSRLLPS